MLVILAPAMLCGQEEQRAQNAYNDCMKRESEASNRVSQLNADYEKIKQDLRSGLFCSKCKRSKTEIEKTGVEFYHHVRDLAKGVVESASQELCDEKYRDYLNSFNQLNAESLRISKECNDKRADIGKARDEEYKRKQEALNEQNEKRRQENDRRNKEIAAENKRKRELAEQHTKDLIAQMQQNNADNSQKVNDAIKDLQDQLNQLLAQKDEPEDAGEKGAGKESPNNPGVSEISFPSHSDTEPAKNTDNNTPPAFDPNAPVMSNDNLNTVLNNNMQKLDHFEEVGDPEDDKAAAVATKKEDSGNGGDPNSGDGLVQLYSKEVKSMAEEQLIPENSITAPINEELGIVDKWTNFAKVADDLTQGKITPDVVKTYFSSTQDGTIRKIQEITGTAAANSAAKANEIADKALSGNYTPEEFDKDVNDLNPIHFNPIPVQDAKPLSAKDIFVVGVGGTILALAGAPIWIGIGAAAWYGFNR